MSSSGVYAQEAEPAAFVNVRVATPVVAHDVLEGPYVVVSILGQGNST